MSKSGGVDTAEQQNVIRRAAKARQQAVVKARSVHKAEHEQFDLQSAAVASRRKQQYLESKEREHTAAVQEAFADLKARGGIRRN